VNTYAEKLMKIKVKEIYWDEKERSPYFVLEDGREFRPIHPNHGNWGFPLDWEEVTKLMEVEK